MNSTPQRLFFLALLTVSIPPRASPPLLQWHPPAQLRRPDDRRPDRRGPPGDATHAPPPRPADGSHVRRLLRVLSGLLPLAGDLPHRPVRAQPPRDGPLSADAAATAASTAELAAGVAPATPATCTAHIGKYLNGYGVQERRRRAARLERVARRRRPRRPTACGATRSTRTASCHTYGRRSTRTRALYQTDVFAASGPVDFIQRRAPERRPFFLSVGLRWRRTTRCRSCAPGPGTLVRPAPSTPRRVGYDAAPGLSSPSPRRASPTSPRSSGACARSSPADMPRSPRGAARPPGSRSSPSTTRSAGSSPPCVARSELDNTYILFTSDNGYMQGEHRRPEREDAPVRAVHRACRSLLRGPGIPRGRRLARAGGERRPCADHPRCRPGATRRQADRRALADPVRAQPGAAHTPPDPSRDRRAALRSCARDQDQRSASPAACAACISYRAVRTSALALRASIATARASCTTCARDPDRAALAARRPAPPAHAPRPAAGAAPADALRGTVPPPTAYTQL